MAARRKSIKWPYFSIAFLITATSNFTFEAFNSYRHALLMKLLFL